RQEPLGSFSALGPDNPASKDPRLQGLGKISRGPVHRGKHGNGVARDRRGRYLARDVLGQRRILPGTSASVPRRNAPPGETPNLGHSGLSRGGALLARAPSVSSRGANRRHTGPAKRETIEKFHRFAGSALGPGYRPLPPRGRRTPEGLVVEIPGRLAARV